jgi:transposase
VEGSGSYGAGLVSHLRRHGHLVVDVNRPDRAVRHLRGKNDTIDAEAAARAVLSGAATAVPKTADGTVEMIRQVIPEGAGPVNPLVLVVDLSFGVLRRFLGASR